MIRWLAVAALVFLAASPRAAESEADAAERIRATIDLTDGSRLIGAPEEATLAVSLDYGRLEIPLGKIREWEPGADGQGAVIRLANGDRLTGTLERRNLRIDTLVGTLSPAIGQIRKVAYAVWREGDMPAGKPGLAFGGVNWQAWRTEFAVEGDRLMSLPKPRAGFRYGHEGHGRGPILVTNVGSPEWRNYSIEADIAAPGIDPAFNPYGLGGDFHEVAVFFHVVDARESQNEPGNSFYSFALHGDGSWELRASYNSFCEQPIGWGNPRHDADRELARGQGLTLDPEGGNHVRIDVVGERIKVWLDDKPLVDLVDVLMRKEVGGRRLDHGGVGFGGGFESMIWIKNFSARALPGPAAAVAVPALPVTPPASSPPEPRPVPAGPIPPTAG